MTTITQTITPLPAAPDAATQTPSAYAVTATAFAEALPALVTEQNTLSGQINTVSGEVAANAVTAAADAVTAAAAATAAENFSGAVEWVSGTTYALGSVVWSPIDFKPYRRIIAGAGITDPSADATNWFSLSPSGAGGATETSSAIDITLTSASDRVQAVAMTTTGKSVNLPDATTLTTGGALFVIKNTGAITLSVRNSAGDLLAPLASGQIVALYLSNNSTAEGTWAVGNESTASFIAGIGSGEILTVNAATSTYISVTALSSTQAIVSYKGVSNYLNVCTLNVSGTTLTAGAVLAINAASTQPTSVTKLSSTQALVTYAEAATYYLNACTLNVSGTTITAGAILVANATSSSAGLAVAALSSTQAVVAYRSGDTGYVEACTLNVSGTTLTAGTILTGIGTIGGTIDMAALSSTQAIIAYGDSSPSYTKSCTLNVSGTTVTAGAIISVNAAASYYQAITALSSTQALVSYQVSNALNARVLDISGTTITATGLVTEIDADDTTYQSVTSLSASKAMIAWRRTSTTFIYYCILDITGTTIVDGAASNITSVANSWPDITALSDGNAILAFQGTPTYLNAAVLEASV